MSETIHSKFMKEALKESKKALELDEVPVGAIIVKDNIIISKAYNLREKLNDPTAHAEIIAIKKACEKLQNWRLTGCSMYVTLEPCPMCAGAIVQSRISNLYIGTFDYTCGACGSVLNITNNDYINSFTNTKWMYHEECSKILKDFFKLKRNKNLKEKKYE